MSDDLNPKHVEFAKSLIAKGFREADIKFELTRKGVEPHEVSRYLSRAQWAVKSEGDLLHNRRMQSVAAMVLGGVLLVFSYLVLVAGALMIVPWFVGIFALITGAVIWAIYQFFPDLGMWLEHHWGYVVASIVGVFLLIFAIIVISQL